MGLEKYGLEVGNHANFVILQAKDTIEAIRLRAHRLAVVRRGTIIAKNMPQVTNINLPGRPSTVQPDMYTPRPPSDM